MQNKYVGDIGDYGKLGLLRTIAGSNLSVGINWYLTPDEKNKNDGRHVDYLYNDRFRSCDESLWFQLRHIVDSGKRNVSSLQNSRILNAVFYSAPLDFSGKTKLERTEIREKWHNDAIKRLYGANVIFVDPDNGLTVPSALGKPRENKYVKPDELSDYYAQGASIIYYQHKARKLDSFYIEQHNHLTRSMLFETSVGLALKFKSVSQRYYFFIVQPHHKARVENAVNQLLLSPWHDHFCLLSL